MSTVRRATRVLAPVAALCMFAAALPSKLPQPRSALSTEACLTMADAPPPAGPDAIARMERCSGLAPNDVELMADLGAAYEAENAPGQAASVYRRALALDPDGADVRVRLARLALGRGDAREARNEAEAALRLQPNRQAIVDLLRAIDAASPAAPR